MQALLRAVREACDPGTWSRGVELARQQVVRGERPAAGDLRLVVAARGLRAARVRIWPDDAEWDCDCDAGGDACEHVAAAVIALRQAREQGRDLPEAEPAAAAGHVGYRLRSSGAELSLARCLVDASGESPLRGSVAALASGRVAGPPLAASEVDLRIEELLRGRDGPVPPGLALGLLRLLARCDDVQLDGRRVGASAEPALPRAVVDDCDVGFRVALEPPEGLERSFANGVVLCAGVLRPRGDAHLGERERRELSGAGRRFATQEAAHLVAEVLPGLERRIPVVVRTQRLPRGQVERPRLLLSSAREGDRLRVRGDLVYGTPPRARVEQGRLVHLEGAIPVRDAAAEERLAARLHRELGLEPGIEVQLDTEQALDLAPRLSQLEGAELRGDASQFRAHGELVASLQLESADAFDMRFRTSGGGRADARAVLRAWESGESWVALDGGGFASLPADWLARHGERVAELLAARADSGRLPACSLPDLARLCDALGAAPPAAAQRLRALVDGFSHVPRAELPRDLRAELRGYQQQGVDWLAFLRDAELGALLADDMGLGKTLQALCALRGRSLVVAPTSVVHAWRAQLERFRPGLSFSLYHGPERALDAGADVTLTTWAILRLDRDALCRVEWDCAVLDEAQAIKNPDSQVARAAFALRARFRLALSGTPVENRLEELWSQMQFANPGLLGSESDFRRRYSQPIASGTAGAAARLRERIRPFVLRRRKAEVAPELPPRTEVELRCELSPEQREIYAAVLAATRRDVVARLQAGGSVFEALEALLRLRQAACHPALVPGRRGGRSGKLEVLLDALEEGSAEGHRSLVFSQWTSLLDLVEPELRAAGLGFERLDGSTRDRAGVVARFQDPGGPPVLLISLRAGGTGLDLTAADQVYLLDPWWNPAVEDQAADRAHRIGQEKPVLISRLVSQDTVEERILSLQSRKRALAESALGGSEGAAAITRDELLALLT
jgi:superfamily II DNA or RNA helicase